MDGIIWGDVATWFTGILTAGSLLLGFTILKRDRATDERQQAARIAVYSVLTTELGPDRGDDDWELTVKLWNHSDTPIFEAQIVGLGDGEDFLLVSEPDEEYDPAILPGANASIYIPRIKYSEAKELYVVFIDDRGVSWKRDLTTRALSMVKN